MNMIQLLYGTRRRMVLAICAVMMAVAVGVSAQPQAQGPPDPVVAEIRALRADLNQRLESSIRMQLLVARLSLQEQRINTVVRQLSDVQDKLKANDALRLQLDQAQKMFGLDKASDKEKEEGKFILGPLKAGLENVEKSDAELTLQLSDLTTLLNQEQARWNGFNRLLDDLEAALSKPVR